MSDTTVRLAVAAAPTSQDLDQRPSRQHVHVAVSKAMLVPAWAAVAVVHDLSLIADFEPKATTVVVRPMCATTGHYDVQGRLFGVIRWRGSFSYELHRSGFDSHLTEPIGGVLVSGGFAVHPCGDTCVVTHYESYVLPARLAWAHRFWRAYVRRTMRYELTHIDALAHRITAGGPHR